MKFVYVFKSEFGLVKVGHSRNPAERLKRICDISTLRLSLAYEKACAQAPQVEKAAHDLLSDYRESGEWFSVSAEEAIRAIESVMAQLEAGIQPRKRHVALSMRVNKGWLAALDTWRNAQPSKLSRAAAICVALDWFMENYPASPEKVP